MDRYGRGPAGSSLGTGPSEGSGWSDPPGLGDADAKAEPVSPGDADAKAEPVATGDPDAMAEPFATGDPDASVGLDGDASGVDVASGRAEARGDAITATLGTGESAIGVGAAAPAHPASDTSARTEASDRVACRTVTARPYHRQAGPTSVAPGQSTRTGCASGRRIRAATRLTGERPVYSRGPPEYSADPPKLIARLGPLDHDEVRLSVRKGRVPGRRLGDTFPASHQGTAQGDAAAR